MQKFTATQIHERQIDSRQYDRIRREYLERIQPLIDIKVSIMSRVMPKLTVGHDGKVLGECVYDYSANERAMLDQCDKEIEQIAAELKAGRGLMMGS
ncbi:hypothetical protein ACTACK_10515 [Pseudomonas syringae]|uniref:hypothetical protein n=1 Tax=Pseudomonas syringae TaxID=317 RepID=UPI003F755E63